MPKWVRCKDPETGHEYDLSDRSIQVREGRVEVLENYPTNDSPTARPRRAKHRTTKAGRPSRKSEAEPTSADQTGSE